MAHAAAALEAEFVVWRTRLPRVTPFPAWNGVVACSRDAAGCISVLSECGRVYILRLTRPEKPLAMAAGLLVSQVLEGDGGSVMAMCQAWAPSGRVLVVARDRDLAVYELKGDRLERVATVSLRFAACSLGVVGEEEGNSLLVVGSAAGVSVYAMEPSIPDSMEVELLESSMHEIAIAEVKFSPDTKWLALGTVDGRVVMRRRTGRSFSELSSEATFIKVLAAPRVTSISFSPSSDKAIVTTRKGNVYVLTRSPSAATPWSVDGKFGALTANPKGGATSQTLSCWWGTSPADATPVFAVGGRVSSCSVELYDVQSATLLHTLVLAKGENGDAAQDGILVASDRHLTGLAGVPSEDATTPPRLVCIDSNAHVSIITWPFLEHACPRYLSESTH